MIEMTSQTRQEEKVKKLYFIKKEMVMDFLRDNFPIRNEDLYKRFPEINRSTLRNYKSYFNRMQDKMGVKVNDIKMLMHILTHKMTPMTHLSGEEQECIKRVGKWLDDII